MYRNLSAITTGFMVVVEGKRVVVQGWGNVGAAAAFYLAQAGAVIVGIIDRAGGLINEEGYSFAEVKALFEAKQGNTLSAPDMLSFEEVNARIWDVQADVFLRVQHLVSSRKTSWIA